MRVFLRRLAYVAIAVVFVLIAAVFAYGNQDPIALDIGIMRFEDVSLTIVLALTFVTGALFGGIVAGIAMFRQFAERRALRRELKRAKSELDSLRSLPLADAD